MTDGRLRLTSTGGFTLVEVMMVVAMLAVLTALAIPKYQEFKLKSIAVEATVNVPTIGDAHLAYLNTYDEGLNGFGWVPAPWPGKKARVWIPGSKFDDLGWAPDGVVRCAYTSSWSAPMGIVSGTANCNLDGDDEDHLIKQVRHVTGEEHVRFSYCWVAGVKTVQCDDTWTCDCW